MSPRYPDIRVQTRSANPLALVSAVRLALRRSRVAAGEIHRFTEEAFRSDEPQAMRRVCSSWVEVSA